MLDRADWKVEVICGDNKKLMESLRDKYYPFKHISVHGFVEDISLYYAASDVVAFKPGGLSSAEAAAMGSAMLLLDPLPGHEQYNCDYLLEHGAALRVYENRRAGELIGELIESSVELKKIRRRAKDLSRPLAARDILRFIADKIAASPGEPSKTQSGATDDAGDSDQGDDDE
jgi:processive 1,2-diacylglycerol beta-glucosyltransferase